MIVTFFCRFSNIIYIPCNIIDNDYNGQSKSNVTSGAMAWI